ncbi:MFS transporter [Tsuneonella mangrovi]|uniref:MFS transporter n=1 Tax=Tsuneonella mangrovi TaxID=1982042 RepID=UPI0030B80C39
MARSPISPDGAVDRADSDRRLGRFIALYGLAWAGGAISYTPFLTILLPVIVVRLSPQGGAVSWLAYITFTGAITASFANIAFGYLSDRTRNRRGWIAAGLALSCVSLMTFSRIDSLPGLLALIVVWQTGLNMMLGPLGALAGDCVPDRRKGVLGGILAFAPALGAVSGALVTLNGLASGDQRLAIVACLAAVCVVPILLVPIRPLVEAMPSVAGPNSFDEDDRQFVGVPERWIVIRMWLARLSLQVSEAALFAYIYLWFRSIDPGTTDNRAATIFSTALLVSAPLALLVGRWSDRVGRPFLALAICAGLASAGLLTMALASTLPLAIAGYLLFGVASAIFLALHTAQTLRILPQPKRRGRDLGLFNLTNTVPSLVMPALTLALVPTFGFSSLFVLLAVLASLSAALLFSISQPE